MSPLLWAYLLARIATQASVQEPNLSSLQWRWENPSPQGNGLCAVAGDTNRICAVGEAGTVMCSLDRGNSWTVSQPIHTILRGVGQLHGTFVAVGDGGVILHSAASDRIWTAVPAVTTANLTAVTTAHHRFIVVGDAGTILISTDDGSHWRRSSDPSPSDLKGIACDGKRCLAFGQKGVLLRSNDAGDHWALVDAQLEDGLTAISIRGKEAMLGTGNDLLLSHDGGASWTRPYEQGTFPVTSIARSERGAGLIGFQGHLQRKRPGEPIGVGMFVDPPGLQLWEEVRGSWIDDSGHAIALGDGGALFSSADGGKAWVARTSVIDGRRGSIDRAWVDHGGTIYVVGEQGTILVRDAHQEQWRTAPPPTVHFNSGHTEALSSPLVAIWGDLNGDTYICDHMGWLYRSRNGGRSWKNLPRLPELATSLWGTDTEMVAAGDAILRSVDHGRTWTSILVVGSDSSFSSIWGRSDGQYFAVGSRGLVMFSADHGLTWERLEGPVSSGLNEVTGDPDQVWAVGDNGVILNFRFGTKRGELVPSGTTAKLSSIARLGRRSLMVVSDDGDILISQTNGTSWSPLPRVTTNPLEKVIVSDNTIWVFGASGTILAADLR